MFILSIFVIRRRVCLTSVFDFLLGWLNQIQESLQFAEVARPQVGRAVTVVSSTPVNKIGNPFLLIDVKSCMFLVEIGGDLAELFFGQAADWLLNADVWAPAVMLSIAQMLMLLGSLFPLSYSKVCMGRQNPGGGII